MGFWESIASGVCIWTEVMFDDACKKGFTLSGAFLVGLAGLTMTIIAGMALNSNNLADADSMINKDTANGDGIPIDVTMWFTCVLIFGILAIISSILGFIGICENSKFLLCMYVVFAFLFACFFLTVGIFTYMIVESVEPTIHRQVDTMCNETNYAQLVTKMSCKVAVAPTTARLLKVVDNDSCGPECEDRVRLIEKLGGCKFLKHACNKKEYEFVGQGFCTLHDQKKPPMYGSEPLTLVSLEKCQDTCDADIECTGVVHEEQSKVCFIITKEGNWPGPQGWILQKEVSDATMPLEGTDATTGASCWRKDVSKLVAHLRRFGSWLLFGCIAFGSVLMFSICCTFSHMYMVNTKRKGRKGFPSLCASMFCPCRGTKSKKRMLRNLDYDEVGSESGSASASESDE